MTDFNEILTLIVSAANVEEARASLAQIPGGAGMLISPLYNSNDAVPRAVVAYVSSGANLGEALYNACYAVSSLYCGNAADPYAKIVEVGYSVESGVIEDA